MQYIRCFIADGIVLGAVCVTVLYWAGLGHETTMNRQTEVGASKQGQQS